MPMSEMEYFRMEENNAIGECIALCAKAIFEARDSETMGQLQRKLYKYTDAGICISFEMHENGMDGNFVYNGKSGSRFIYSGDDRAYEVKEPWLFIAKIGVSSIVEGSDAEVPLEWIDLVEYCDDSKYGEDFAQCAVKDFDDLCDNVDKEACHLWREATND